MVSVLSKITNFSFLKTENNILGIDIGSSAIKIVQIEKQGGKAILKNYGSLSLGPYSELSIGQAVNLPKRKIVEAILDLVRETGITAKDVAMAIPMKDTMISFIKMPNLGKKQLEHMVPIEARRHIPVPMSEVTLDFWVIPKQEDVKSTVPSPGKVEQKKSNDKIDVLVAAIHNSSINKYQDIKNLSGLNVKLFEIEVFSIIRSTAGHNMKPVMIIDIGAAITKLAMVEYGVLQSVHIINKGSQDVTMALSRSLGISVEQAEELKRNPDIADSNISKEKFFEIASFPISYIFSEANNVLLDYQNKHSRPISQIILSGGGSLVNGLPEFAKDNFKVDVVVGNPFSMLDAPAFLRETLKGIGPEFSVAIGLALEAV